MHNCGTSTFKNVLPLFNKSAYIRTMCCIRQVNPSTTSRRGCTLLSHVLWFAGPPIRDNVLRLCPRRCSPVCRLFQHHVSRGMNPQQHYRAPFMFRTCDDVVGLPRLVALCLAHLLFLHVYHTRPVSSVHVPPPPSTCMYNRVSPQAFRVLPPRGFTTNGLQFRYVF